MTVTSFELATCPLVSGADAAASRRLGRCMAGWPPAWSVDLPLLGKATLMPAAIAAGVPSDAIALAVRREGMEGRLSIPAPLASRWVDLALCGAEGFGPARELGRAERGVLIALLAPLLDAIGWSLGLGSPPERDGPAIALGLSGAAGGGTLWLQIPPSRSGGCEVSVERAAGLSVVGRPRLASTRLTQAQVGELAVGDAVVFDGVAGTAADAQADVDLGLWLGRFCAMLRVAPDGRATVLNAWRHATDMHDVKDVTMDEGQSAARSADALAEAPIEVVAELGRLTLRAEDVLGLAPGAVLGLRIERTTAVALRIGGQLWAEGELVNVDGELGVRVTRLARG
jgi:type III secretion system YscQ/HrcQ family protein